MTTVQGNNGKHDQGHQKAFVLVVDADSVQQLKTSLFLQRLDYHAFSVKTAEDALTILGYTLPQLVITDVTLPQMSGFDLLTKIKENKRTREIPVLMYTALQDPAYRQVSMQAGCAGYLVRPIEPNQLYAEIQKATESFPRQFVRLNTLLEVIVGAEGIPGFAVRKEKVTALSENGMYVSTPVPLPFGTVFPFTLFLKAEQDKGVNVEGKVLYSHDGKTGDVKQSGMGVKFTLIRPEDSGLIKTYIKEKLTEGIAVAIQSPRR